ncbi:MAG: hypothetical protein ABI239_13450 [Aquihabitans sp.]
MGYDNIFYGIDIETDTTGAVDPAVAAIRTVALSGVAFDEEFTGPEPELLRALNARLAGLPAGVLATWNGATFDLPYIADRARVLGVELDLRLCRDRSLTFGRTLLPGHGSAYRGVWGDHGHIDAFRLYGHAGGPSVWSSLRTIGRLVGLGATPTVIRRHDDLTNEALHAHAKSDARLARVLAERRRVAALRLVDQVEAAEVQPVSVAEARLARQARQAAGTDPAYQPVVAV